MVLSYRARPVYSVACGHHRADPGAVALSHQQGAAVADRPLADGGSIVDNPVAAVAWTGCRADVACINAGIGWTPESVHPFLYLLGFYLP